MEGGVCVISVTQVPCFNRGINKLKREITSINEWKSEVLNWDIPWLVVTAAETSFSASVLFLVDRSTGELLLASLWTAAGWSVLCCSDVAVLSAVWVLLSDGPEVGSSWDTVGLLLEVFSVWINWASWGKTLTVTMLIYFSYITTY